MQLFTWLFDASGFPPRWYCGSWSPELGWLHILSDLAVWAAYLAIPLVIGYFALRRKDVPFRKVFWLFGAFILACGATHLMEAIIFWWPAYRLAGLIKLFTAIVSWATVVALVPIVPKALAVRSADDFQREIDERKRAEEALRESEERFRGTFENAAVGIAHKDAAGRWLRVNEKYCEIVGYSREELLQKTFQDISHPDDLATTLTCYTQLMKGELPSFSQEKRYIRKNGSLVWIDMTLSVQRDGGGQPEYAIAILQDISERKRLEEEFRQAKEDAEAANRSKDEFLANVSHEIRTPLNAILGMTELALDSSMAEDQRQCLETVRSAAENLLAIINDLLDFSKIAAGKLELDVDAFSLRSSLGDTLRALAMRAHKKGLELVSHVQQEAPDALIGDAGRLRQVVLNLVGNAIKFTEDGEVVVTVDVVGPSADDGGVDLRFTVRDTGIGIPPDKQEKVFRAFEQEDSSTTRKYGGTGLGLTIAARLVTLMGGSIRLESRPGRGSTFSFTARFGRQPHASERVPLRPPALLLNLPVLIVDDNITNCRILEEWLRNWQMESTAVSDAAAAMDALWHGVAMGRPYALVLLDACMPGTSGLSLAAMIRDRAELSPTRIILLTSAERPGDQAQTRMLHIEARMLKPIPQDELLDTIYRVMSRADVDASPTRSAKESAATALQPMRILVAEDNEFNARHLERLLGRRGHSVQLADNGRHALGMLGLLEVDGTAKLCCTPGSQVNSDQTDTPPTCIPVALTTQFDVMLLDLHMPELDGFGVIRSIREWERTASGHLPVIALTARSRKEDRERCLESGMDDYLSKPVRSSELFAAIERVTSSPTVSAPGRADPEVLSTLLDVSALRNYCGDVEEGLEELCQDFMDYAPARLAAVSDAFRFGDATQLREAAHKLCGLVSAFSARAGDAASDVEMLAAQDRLHEAGPLLARLESMVQTLNREVKDLLMDRSNRRAQAVDGPQSG